MVLDQLIADVLAYADGCGVGDEPLVTPVAELSLKRCQAPTPIEHAVHQPEFCLVLQGAKQVISGQDSLSFGRMESLIVSLDLPMLSWITVASLAKPYVALALAIDVALLQALAQKIGLARLLRTGCAAMTSSTPDPILDAMRRLFDLIKRPEAAPVLQPLILREIHNWLLTSSHGHLLRDLTHADCHAARIARAIALIRRDYASLLRISALAGVAGMSVSAFHGHFRQITGTTPLQFPKQLKPAEARRLLVAERRSVASAAFEVGYESPTQFSREYGRQFGASPRQDLARSRALG